MHAVPEKWSRRQRAATTPVACQEDSDSASISVQPMGSQNVIMILYPLITSVTAEITPVNYSV
jgi:hypothetical protein